jgi:hypothetical protein
LVAKQSTNSRVRSSSSCSRSSKMLRLNRSCMSRKRGFLPSVDMTRRRHLVRHLGHRKLSRRSSYSRSRYKFMIPVSATRNVNTISARAWQSRSRTIICSDGVASKARKPEDRFNRLLLSAFKTYLF